MYDIKRLLILSSILVPAVQAQAFAQDEIIVTAPKLNGPVYERVYARTILDQDYLQNSANERLDAALSGVAGFSLFRRSDSRSANPTTQGATLRGLGPNGAGRTLVLLDGVPQNDPFGGWIYWSTLPRAALSRVVVHRGGGAGPFGSGALSGVVELETAPVEPGIAADVAGGSRGLFSGYLTGGAHLGPVRARLQLYGGREDGFHLLPKDQRGAVDVPAAYRQFGGSLDLATDIGERVVLSARVAGFAENRINGNLRAPNETEAFEFNVRLAHPGEDDEQSWSVVAFGQEREFAQTFVSVRDERTTSRPVLDQFDVPSQAFGLRADYRIPWGSGAHQTRLSGDLRWTDGETNELFRNLGAGFTRQRRAGGEQFTGGVSLEQAWVLRPALTLTGGVRLDRWRNSSGERTEADRSDGQVLLDVDVENQGDWRSSGRVGFAYELTPALSVRGSGYTGFRVPTLNELHRPFRVRNDITEANSSLRPERLRGLEAGVHYVPLNGVNVDITWFSNWVHDAVANVTLAQGPGVFPVAGFVPPGGSLRQRQNIERLRVDGLEFSAQFELSNGFGTDVFYSYTDAKVKRARLAPLIEGNRLIQVPRHSGRWALYQEVRHGFRWSTALRFATRQFDDDLNARILDGYVALDAHISYRVNDGIELYIAGENLTDTRIEAARSGDGLITRGTPLSVRAGLKWAL